MVSTKTAVHNKNPGCAQTSSKWRSHSEKEDKNLQEYFLFVYSLQQDTRNIKEDENIEVFSFNNDTENYQVQNLLWLMLQPSSLQTFLKRLRVYVSYLKKLKRNDIRIQSITLHELLETLFFMYKQDLITVENGLLVLSSRGKTKIYDAQTS